jgi:hypothetical protein
MTKWFEWNKQDLSQFDPALVTGPAVSGSSFSFIPSDGGIPFIELSVTAGAHANGALSQAVLLITETPPDDMILVADVISVTSIGGGLVARYTNVNSGYDVRLVDGTYQRADKLAGTVGAPTISQIGGSMSDPVFSIGSKIGMRFGIGVEGQSWVRLAAGEEQVISDLSSPYTSGKAGLWVTCQASPQTVTMRFCNICGYDLT